MKKQPIQLIDNSKNKNMELIYTDKCGNEYYKFIDPETMPKVRIVACERAARYAELYVSERNMKKFIASMREAGGKGDYVKVFSMINQLEYNLNYLGEAESLLEIAACFFLFKDEDPEELFTKDLSDKIDLWNRDKKARDFFLSKAIPITSNYSQKSPEGILNYLESQQHVEMVKQFNHFIS
jgi:hypothetical protein